MNKFNFRPCPLSIHLSKTISLFLVLLGLWVVFPGQIEAIVVPTYTITDLGTLPGGISSQAYGINNNGQVVGDSTTSNTYGFLYDISTKAMTNLGTLPGRNESRARGINNAGQVVGSSYNHAFRYSIGEDGLGNMEDLGALPEKNVSYGFAINSLGDVVGQSMVPPPGGLGASPYHAFLYSGSGPMTDLGSVTTEGYGESHASGINDNGWIVGTAMPPGNVWPFHAFIYANGVMTDIGVIAEAYGYYSQAIAINNAGQVAGSLYPKTGGGTYFAVIYENGSAKFLGTLGGAGGSHAYGINSSGQVVGYSMTRAGYQHPFLYTKGRMIDLTALVVGTNPFAQLQMATAINDHGYIVGSGIMPDGSGHAFLATPGSMKVIGYVPYDLLLLD